MQEFTMPIYKMLITTLDKFFKSKLKDLKFEHQIFSRYTKRKQNTVNLKLKKNASESNSESESESEDEDNNSQSDKVSSVASDSRDSENGGDTKNYEKLVQFRIWYLKDDKEKVSKCLEKLGNFSDERIFDHGAVNALKSYKRDGALSKYFTYVYIKGRKVWFHGLEVFSYFFEDYKMIATTNVCCNRKCCKIC
jgi:hypothetical protein